MLVSRTVTNSTQTPLKPVDESRARGRVDREIAQAAIAQFRPAPKPGRSVVAGRVALPPTVPDDHIVKETINYEHLARVMRARAARLRHGLLYQQD